jgi:hypothetical protein
MINRRFIIKGLVAAPAIIAADRLMAVHSIVDRYATVYGIGLDGEYIEHVIWEPMSVAHFGGTPAIDQFREVTDWVYSFPVQIDPIPRSRRLLPDEIVPPNTISTSDYRIFATRRYERIPATRPDGTTEIATFAALKTWVAEQGQVQEPGHYEDTPNRAELDDARQGGHNIHDRGKPMVIDAIDQARYDARQHQWGLIGCPEYPSPKQHEVIERAVQKVTVQFPKLIIKPAF